jgi:hypothetical protein
LAITLRPDQEDDVGRVREALRRTPRVFHVDGETAAAEREQTIDELRLEQARRARGYRAGWKHHAKQARLALMASEG